MQEAIVRELWTYPVKGCQGVAAEAIQITKMGISGDRDFALWKDGKLVDQKETPQVASLAADFDRDQGVLRFRHSDHGVYEHEIRSEGVVRKAAWVLDEFETVDQGDSVADWLSTVVGKGVRLVSPGAPWKINFPIPQMQRVHEKPKQRFFAASPVSLANRASLDDLNKRLETPVPMDRFRMNVVIEGLGPYEEDKLDSLSNEQVELLQVTPAERCIIITTDQKTGERPKSDLMGVLGQYRQKKQEDRFGSGLIFGNYMTVGKEGTLRVGDRLVVA
jgi:uncharacterized protein YcbX